MASGYRDDPDRRQVGHRLMGQPFSLGEPEHDRAERNVQSA
jgi:hypothetical protein